MRHTDVWRGGGGWAMPRPFFFYLQLFFTINKIGGKNRLSHDLCLLRLGAHLRIYCGFIFCVSAFTSSSLGLLAE
jgi:hypothetical protein